MSKLINGTYPDTSKLIPNSFNTITDLSPNCMWFAEHILNGDTKNTDLCPWYIDCRYRIPIQ